MEEEKEESVNSIIELLSKYPEGLRDEEFDNHIDLTKEEKVELINNLLLKGRIVLLETRGGDLVYKLQSKEKIEKYKQLSESEKPIYQLLEDAGNRGLCTREIKEKTGITTVRINKILGSMEDKGLIKVYKSIQGKKKKVYMLSEVEPSSEITGGIWYNESEFNTELIERLCEKCIAYIERKGTASRKEITLYIRTLGLVPGDMQEEDLQSILNILYFDDKIEFVKDQAEEGISPENRMSGAKVYRVKKKYEPEMALLNVPCIYCPLMKECHPDGVVSPSTCLYYKEWIEGSKDEI